MKTAYIKVGDTFTNDFGNTCTITKISEPLVMCDEEICQTDDEGYTETVGTKEVRYTIQEMKRMFNCKYLHVGDPDEDNEDED